MLQRAAHGADEVVELERLLDERESERASRGLGFVDTAQHDRARTQAAAPADLLIDIDPVHLAGEL